MINWKRVAERFIVHLYQQGLGAGRISEIAQGECSKKSIMKELKKLGIEIKRRGGANNFNGRRRKQEMNEISLK